MARKKVKFTSNTSIIGSSSEESEGPNKQDGKGNLKLFVGTWNMAGIDMSSNEPIEDWINPDKDSSPPDIYIVGFQEIVELNVGNIFLSSNEETVGVFKNILKRNLKNIGSYELIKETNLVGICQFAFVKKSLVKEIKNLDFLILKTGVLGMAGNKGSCIIRFDLLKKSFAFSCGHYASGEENNDDRLKELSEVMEKNVKENSNGHLRLIDHDVAFVFGDLNFRVNMDNMECRSQIKSKKLKSILSRDQFLIERKRNPSYQELEEGEITFYPTFKFDFNSREYDTSKKKRIPSWTDRIFWKKSSIIQQYAYNSVPDYLQSDHRPVYALFYIQVTKEGKDVDKTKEKIKKNMDTYDITTHNNKNTPTKPEKKEVIVQNLLIRL